jgi:hypothetical protein
MASDTQVTIDQQLYTAEEQFLHNHIITKCDSLLAKHAKIKKQIATTLKKLKRQRDELDDVEIDIKEMIRLTSNKDD